MLAKEGLQNPNFQGSFECKILINVDRGFTKQGFAEVSLNKKLQSIVI